MGLEEILPRSTPKLTFWALLLALSAGIIWYTRTFHKDFGPEFRSGLTIAWAFLMASFLLAPGKIWAYTLAKDRTHWSYWTVCIEQGWLRWLSPFSPLWSLAAFLTFAMGVILLWVYVWKNVAPNQ